LAVLSADYFSVPEEEIKRIEAVLTMMNGKVVYAAGEFANLSPPPPPASPDWSPVNHYGGYQQDLMHAAKTGGSSNSSGPSILSGGCWDGGCDCFVV
jgi:hypothetical protein